MMSMQEYAEVKVSNISPVKKVRNKKYDLSNYCTCRSAHLSWHKVTTLVNNCNFQITLITLIRTSVSRLMHTKISSLLMNTLQLPARRSYKIEKLQLEETDLLLSRLLEDGVSIARN